MPSVDILVTRLGYQPGATVLLMLAGPNMRLLALPRHRLPGPIELRIVIQARYYP